MARVLTAAFIATSLATRFPNPGGFIDSLSASGDEGQIEEVHAQSVRGFSQPKGKLQYVKATELFYEAGELVNVGDYVQMTERDAHRIVRAGRAVLATDEEVAAAQSESGSTSGKGKK